MDKLNSYLEFVKLLQAAGILNFKKNKTNLIFGGFLPLGLTLDRGIWNSVAEEGSKGKTQNCIKEREN